MSDPNTVEEWVSSLSDTDMPIFGYTASKLASLARDETSSAAELARVILRDPSMTARVLKIANNAYYNVSNQVISTISRAVVLLGFDSVQSICLSVSIVDQLLKGPSRTRVFQEVGYAFHAAIQAKSMVKMLGEDAIEEEVFISAMLYNLGEMAFWCFANEKSEALEHALALGLDTQENIETDVLGFNLKELTLSLSTQWQLGDTLIQALSDSPNKKPWISCITLAYQIAVECDKGWDHPDITAIVAKIAKIVKLEPFQLLQILKNNAAEAVRQVKLFKLDKALEYIPMEHDEAGQCLFVEDEDDDKSLGIEPNETLQLEILGELMGSIQESPDLSLVLQMVLEGMHRGVGLDRVLVSILKPGNKLLQSKFELSIVQDNLHETFKLDFDTEDAQLFVQVLATQKVVWIGEASETKLNALRTKKLIDMLQVKDFFVAPIIIMGKPIGLFYADRQPSKRALDEKSFIGFTHFSRQANLCLDIMHAKRAKQKRK